MALDGRPASDDDDDAPSAAAAESPAGALHDGDGEGSSGSEGDEDGASSRGGAAGSGGESSDSEDDAPPAPPSVKAEPADDAAPPQRPVQWQLKRGTPPTQPLPGARPTLTWRPPLTARGMPADPDSVARATALLRYQLDLELLLKRNELQTIKSRIAQAEELSRALRAAILQCACGGRVLRAKGPLPSGSPWALGYTRGTDRQTTATWPERSRTARPRRPSRSRRGPSTRCWPTAPFCGRYQRNARRSVHAA